MPLMANAGGKHQTYGAVHLSVNNLDESGLSVDGSAPKANKIGMKGSMDSNIADFKAVYQLEVGFEIGSDKTIRERDTWVGLSSKSMGTVRLGTMATHYKQTGKMTDALFTTSAEGRSLIKTQSATQHLGYGAGRGRADQMVRYDSPSISGAKVIAHYQFTSMENNLGLGLQYKAGNYLAFFDYIDVKTIATKAGDVKSDKTAMKVGGKAKFGPASLALSYEIDDDGSIQTTKAGDGGGNQLHVQGTYTMGASTLIATVGHNDENNGYAIAVSQKVAKKASAYVAYAADGSGDDDSTAISVGMKVAFGS